MGADYLFSNFIYHPSFYYFFYIGEIKALGLNTFVQQALARETDREVRFVAIVPDILEQYHYQDIIVINPRVGHAAETRELPVSGRPDTVSFMEAVSNSKSIQELIAEILRHQEELFIYLFESIPEMTLDEQFSRVSILGPDKQIARKLNNKAVQYQLLEDVVPTVDYRICQGRKELLEVTEQLRCQWSDGIFVTYTFSAAGAGSCISYSREDITSRFPDGDDVFLISRYLQHDYDPTVLAVAASEKEIFVAGVADQVIVDGNRFVGSTFPSVLPVSIQKELIELTRQVGKKLAGQGYRGIYGCDYLVTADGEIRFIEVNARKQGTTLEYSYTLEQNLGSGVPSLPELELRAVRDGSFYEVFPEPACRNPRNICWGTYNYKIMDQCRTRKYLPHNCREGEMFSKVAANQLEKKFVLLEHIGSGYEVLAGTFLARTVSVAHNHADVREGLDLAKEIIGLTIQ